MQITNVPESPMGQLFQRYITCMQEKDVSNLIHLYDENCLLISALTKDKTPQLVRGRLELEEFYKNRLFGLEDLSVQICLWAETETALMAVEVLSIRVSGQNCQCSVYDNWILTNEKIYIHFAGAIAYPDGTYSDGSVIRA